MLLMPFFACPGSFLTDEDPHFGGARRTEPDHRTGADVRHARRRCLSALSFVLVDGPVGALNGGDFGAHFLLFLF